MDVETVVRAKHHAQRRDEGRDVVVNDDVIHTKHHPSGGKAGLSLKEKKRKKIKIIQKLGLHFHVSH